MYKEKILEICKKKKASDNFLENFQNFKGNFEDYYFSCRNDYRYWINSNCLDHLFLQDYTNSYNQNFIKIGFEFEGVICKNNIPIEKECYKLLCWQQRLHQIINQTPVDNMRSLAEFRTTNIETFPYYRELYNSTIKLADPNFSIAWKELNGNFPKTMMLDKKSFKRNLIDGKEVDVSSSNFRGGGLHVTISGIDFGKVTSFVNSVYEICFHLCKPSCSKYRQYGLYRLPFHKNGKTLVPCVEIIGLSLDMEEDGWFQKLEKINKTVLNLAVAYKK